MKNRGFLKVLFMRAIRGALQRRMSVVQGLRILHRVLVCSDHRDQTSHSLIIEARIRLADDGRVESARDSLAFKSVGFDYRVNV
jgi:hypothetical protein